MHRRRRTSLLLSVLLTLLLALPACECRPSTVKLAFIGTLTGRSGGLGVEGREGFLLAVQEINAAGGVDGIPVEALVFDDRLDETAARKALEEVAAAGAVGVVGPMASQMAVTMTPLAAEAGLVMISPTVSTDELTGKDDFFLRVYYTNAQAARALAGLVAGERGLKRIAALYNSDNRAYTENWLNHFREDFAVLGGEVVAAVPFRSQENPNYTRIASEVLVSRPEGVLILANAVDTGMFSQQIVKNGGRLPLFATGWSFTDDLLGFGGGAVEGLTLYHSVDMTNQRPAFKAFEKDYQTAYGRTPRFPAIHAYDATRLLAAGLARTGGKGGRPLRAALLAIRPFEGLQGAFSLDRFGDVENPPLFLAEVREGCFTLRRPESHEISR